jgi:hypothetical protein
MIFAIYTSLPPSRHAILRTVNRIYVQSSLFTFPLEDPTLEWCLIGEDGLDVESPALFTSSKGFRGNRRLSSSLLSSLGV